MSSDVIRGTATCNISLLRKRILINDSPIIPAPITTILCLFDSVMLLSLVNIAEVSIAQWAS